MQSTVLEIRTGGQATVHDLTSECERFVSRVVGDAGSAGRTDGLLHVFVPHATAGLALIETGSGSEADLLGTLERLLPTSHAWRHRHGSAGHGRDHVVPAFLSPSLVLPVLAGRLDLGTWQRVCLVDTNRDNQYRNVRLSFLAG
ncbi:MAG TPA: YjbQ family protein [Actinopolymorphaceae bacterium]|jgi:secondary thiamine-phosphate synthase enzyme